MYYGNDLIDLKRVYASGYSNGAFFSYGLACHFSDKIAAIGSVAGTMLAGTYSSCQASAPKAMINIHGTSDFVVPYNGANGTTSIENVLNFWTNLNDSKNESINIFNNIEHYVFSDDIGNSYVEHFKVIDGGHYWDDKLDFNGKNTSNLIWNFVSKYDINGNLTKHYLEGHHNNSCQRCGTPFLKTIGKKGHNIKPIKSSNKKNTRLTRGRGRKIRNIDPNSTKSVSYTHLTLPTKA